MKKTATEKRLERAIEIQEDRMKFLRNDLRLTDGKDNYDVNKLCKGFMHAYELRMELFITLGSVKSAVRQVSDI